MGIRRFEKGMPRECLEHQMKSLEHHESKVKKMTAIPAAIEIEDPPP